MTGQQLGLLEDVIDVEFRAFHHDHPQVYRSLVDLARVWRNAGHDRCSIGLLFEVLRWETGLIGGDDFKLNNNFRSRYSRLIMANEPDLDGFFNVRVLHADYAEAWA